ncbi:Hypothetical predicted protein [Mytilus galloprovincialis]|uniref:Uncharacterized protein n=1 Tax=Mytilus galloprovincialis TaxID=29158 RepID=A0A8B6HE05_MYTGA|nr:Hypothetical predicted protein [Mytilus galloprovincialis]
MPNESSCNCKKSIAMKASSTDTTTVATPALESTIDKVKHKTKTKGKSRLSDLTDTEHNISSNDGIDVIRALNCNGQIVKEYNNIPPKSHMNTSNDGMDVIRALNCNEQMDNEYNNIPPKSHMTLSSFSNIPYTNHVMVFERTSTSGKSTITFVEASEL